MRPILFTFGHFTVRSNLIFVLIAFLLGSYLASYEARRKGVDSKLVKDFAYWALIAGLVGGRLSYIVFSGSTLYYVKNPVSLLPSLESGFILYGLLAGVTLSAWLYSIRHKLVPFRFLDTLTPGIVLSLGIGGIGNLLMGDAFGKPTDLPWGLVFPIRSPIYLSQVGEGIIPFGGDPQAVHPTQIYEFIAATVILLLLWLFKDRFKRDGSIFFIYLTIYSAWRFFLEFLRGDSIELGGISLAFIISGFVFLTSVISFFYLARRE